MPERLCGLQRLALPDIGGGHVPAGTGAERGGLVYRPAIRQDTEVDLDVRQDIRFAGVVRRFLQWQLRRRPYRQLQLRSCSTLRTIGYLII